MLVSDLMSSPVYAVRPQDPVASARNLMLRHRISRLLVMEQGNLAGIVTRRDIGFLHERSGPLWKRRVPDGEAVSSVMTEDAVWISPDAGVRDAMFLMHTHGVSGFPVMDQGRVLGIITKSDLIRSDVVSLLDRDVLSLVGPVPVITGEESLDSVIDLIRTGCGKVVVADQAALPIGIISESDLAFYEERVDMSEPACAADLMRRPVITLGRDAHVRDVLIQIREKRITSVVITDEREIKGIITRDDIIREVVL